MWSSDLLRARQTAESIARDHGVEPVTDARLRDVALGRLEGASYDALVAEETPPGAHVAEVRWGGGESLADVAVRVRSLLGDLASTFGGDDEVVVVSHADTLKLLVTLINGGGHRDIDWDAPWATWPNGHLESRRWLPGPGPLSPPAGSRAGSPAR